MSCDLSTFCCLCDVLTLLAWREHDEMGAVGQAAGESIHFIAKIMSHS